MNKLIIFLLFILINTGTFAQQIKKESIDSGGGIATASGIIAIQTIGETVIAEKNEATLHVSEGFISPDLLQSLGIQDFTSLEGVTAYPNPTTKILYIAFPNTQNYRIQVFDMRGKALINQDNSQNKEIELDLSLLETATYTVVVKNLETKQYAMYKIIKKTD